MKLYNIILIIVAGSLWQMPCSAGQSNFCLTSPDRPNVWYNRTGDKLSQYLEWSRTKGQLVLHIAYANVSDTAAAWTDQSYIDTFELAFPTVHLDSTKDRLYIVNGHGRESTIGHLESGILGIRVVLDKEFELSAHRRDGVIQAVIKSVSSPSQ